MSKIIVNYQNIYKSLDCQIIIWLKDSFFLGESQKRKYLCQQLYFCKV